MGSISLLCPCHMILQCDDFSGRMGRPHIVGLYVRSR
jgi:hypothetical protein